MTSSSRIKNNGNGELHGIFYLSREYKDIPIVLLLKLFYCPFCNTAEKSRAETAAERRLGSALVVFGDALIMMMVI
jgi:hypothetical protein